MSEDVTDTPSKQKGVRLSSNETARYGFTPHHEAVPVKAGERYRLSAWFKIDEKTIVEPGSPGVILRATLFSNLGPGPIRDYKGGHIYIGARGAVLQNSEKLFGVPASLQWRKAEAVIEIPDTVKELKFYLFCWYTSGNVYFADFKCEKVAGTTPVTPLL